MKQSLNFTFGNQPISLDFDLKNTDLSNNKKKAVVLLEDHSELKGREMIVEFGLSIYELDTEEKASIYLEAKVLLDNEPLCSYNFSQSKTSEFSLSLTQTNNRGFFAHSGSIAVEKIKEYSQITALLAEIATHINTEVKLIEQQMTDMEQSIIDFFDDRTVERTQARLEKLNQAKADYPLLSDEAQNELVENLNNSKAIKFYIIQASLLTPKLISILLDGDRYLLNGHQEISKAKAHRYISSSRMKSE